LIPQRNISLLANRLARAGGRRIPESVLERDYCIAWLLSSLAGSGLRGKLAFKGGTALKRCYFGDYRFSEDLDFTLLEATSFEDLRLGLEPVYATVRADSGIEFAFDRDDRNTHANSHTFYMRYIGPLPAGGTHRKGGYNDPRAACVSNRGPARPAGLRRVHGLSRRASCASLLAEGDCAPRK